MLWDTMSTQLISYTNETEAQKDTENKREVGENSISHSSHRP